jgi:hypothetical protein
MGTCRSVPSSIQVSRCATQRKVGVSLPGVHRRNLVKASLLRGFASSKSGSSLILLTGGTKGRHDGVVGGRSVIFSGGWAVRSSLSWPGSSFKFDSGTV